MAYEKQTWQTGDTITADKLNHIEDGIGGSSLMNPYKIEVEKITGEQGTQYVISQATVDYIIENKPIFIYGSRIITQNIQGENSGTTVEIEIEKHECYCFNGSQSPKNSGGKVMEYRPLTSETTRLAFFNKEIMSQIDPNELVLEFLQERFIYDSEKDYWITAAPTSAMDV